MQAARLELVHDIRGHKLAVHVLRQAGRQEALHPGMMQGHLPEAS